MPCSALYYLLHVFDPTGLPYPRRFFGNQRWQCSSGSCCSSFSLVFMTLFTYIFLISIYPVTVTHLLDSGKNQRLALDSLYFYSEAQSDPERLRSSKWRRPILRTNSTITARSCSRAPRTSEPLKPAVWSSRRACKPRQGAVYRNLSYTSEKTLPSFRRGVVVVVAPVCTRTCVLWVWWVSILEVKHFVKNLLFKMRRKKKDYFIHGLLIFGTVCFLAKLFCHAHINIYYALLF